MKYEERKEVVTHAKPQQVTLVLCTRCSARPDGLDLRPATSDEVSGWDMPSLVFHTRAPENRTSLAHAHAITGQFTIILCPACTKEFHEFMARGDRPMVAAKGESK